MTTKSETDFQWRGLYEAAMLELNPADLLHKVEIAQATIRQRSAELMHPDYAHCTQERRALADALSNLEALERSELKPPHIAKTHASHNPTVGGAI